ncbi:hypothetical protein BOTBODRAFT_26289 [Botryobasidium botryosum FD-172 SS1]|uniref:Prefoldin subunit 4 n=1 Tax=Botryobasidium botryosum (strain FD-172 SS1) TaxID=930990 RepID=A0A067NCQ8_BOTB1|nr:hypothetical protein BOTBODRAFT_26289 [Botryobasidium botryosum FD-172 SS1]
MRMLNPQEEEDSTEVTWEDQQKINTFSKLNSRMKDIEEQYKEKKADKEALDDLAMELELADEDELVLYRVGDVFVHMTLERAQARLEKDQEKIDGELSKLREVVEDCEKQMKELKVILYGRFGKAINLD